MTRGQLLKLLTEEAREYRKEALSSLERNSHMNDLSEEDFERLRKNRLVTKKLIDALLVDFINYVATGQCCDYGLHTGHISNDCT